MSLMCDGNLDGGWANLGGCLRTSTSKIIYTFFCKKASSFIPSEKGQTGNYINGATVENRDSTATFVYAFNLCHVILLKAERQKVRLTWTENSSTSEGTFRIYKLRMFSEDPAFFFFLLQIFTCDNGISPNAALPELHLKLNLIYILYLPYGWIFNDGYKLMAESEAT